MWFSLISHFSLSDVDSFAAEIITKNIIYTSGGFKLIAVTLHCRNLFFSYICLNNPRYHTDKKSNKIDKSCKKDFINYLVVKEIKIKDYLIMFLEYNT